MKEGADIIGNALKDYMAGDLNATIRVYSDIAEPDTLITAYFFRDYGQMPALEQHALELCYGKIADLGAGAGSHALVLQNQNAAVTAYDISKGACSVMKKRGVKQVCQSSVFQLGSERYDTLLMLMNGIGLVNTIEGLVLFLNQVKANINPGGQIIADSSDITYMYYDEEGALQLNLNAEYHGVVTYQMEYKKIKGQPFTWLFIDYLLLEQYAQQCGYACKLLAEGDNYQYLVQLTLQP